MQHQAYRSPGARSSSEGLLTAVVSRIWSFTRNRPIATLALSALLLIVVAALLADVIATHDPLAQDDSQRLKPPGADHYFGTDGFGRDVFSRVVHGARASLSVAFLAVGVAAVAGTSIGMFSAYWGRKLDLLVQRLVDVLLGFPFLVLALHHGRRLGAFPYFGRRRHRAFADPSGCSSGTGERAFNKGRGLRGGGKGRRGRPLPDHLETSASQQLPRRFWRSSRVFRYCHRGGDRVELPDLGVPPPFPSWGRMLQEGVRQYFEAAPWVTVFPGLALSITVLSSALLGDALRDLLDPRRVLLARRRPKDSSLG